MRLIGTAGHIDHGKSTLVQALTGIHPSHLPEEHARGMTIDLGYAHLDHPDGYKLGIVDVPGHEKLIKNMVAGATGFELAIWVVDARESVMRQSLEHLQILDLLDVRSVIPVVTKADLATEADITTTLSEIAELLRRVRVPVQPAQVVDSVSGRGIPELKEAIFASCRDGERVDSPLPYLPIDRVFTVRGIGTVVTGTLMRGQLTEGAHVAISGQPGTWRVRSLNSHHTRVVKIGAGHRVGVNVAGLGASAVRRGDTVIAPDYPYTGRFLNVRLHGMESTAPGWKHGLRLLFYAGCTETECRLWGLIREEDTIWAQVEIPTEIPFFPGQRFILRNTNPLVTIGGGEVLDLTPDRPRRVTPGEQSAYALRERGEPWLAAYLAGTSTPVLELSALARRWMVPDAALLEQAEGSPELRAVSGLVWRVESGVDLLERLREFVADQPRGDQSVPYDRLARELKIRSVLLQQFLQCLLGQDHPAATFLRAHTRLDGAGLVLYPGRIAFTPEEQRVAEHILERLGREGLRPSRVQDYREIHPRRPDLVDRVFVKLRDARQVVPISDSFVLHPTAAEELHHAPVRHGLDGVRAAEFGKALGLSRKYSIPFLEYLNREGILRRDGDLHYRAMAHPSTNGSR